MNPTLVLLAAGMSTRYGRLKQLEPLGPEGEALLDYAVYDAHRAGFSRVLLIIREELEEAFREHVQGRWPAGLGVEFHHQRLGDLPGLGDTVLRSPELAERLDARTKPWGTAHALLTALDRLNGPFALANADDFYGEEAFRLARGFFAGSAGSAGATLPTFGLVTYTLRDTLSESGGVSRGICRVDEEGWLRGIQEALEIQTGPEGLRGKSLEGSALTLSGGEPISTNFWLFHPGVLSIVESGFRGFMDEVLASAPSRQPEFLIPIVVNRSLQEGSIQIRAIPTSGRFLGITHPQDREGVMRGLAELVEEGQDPPFLWGSRGGREWRG